MLIPSTILGCQRIASKRKSGFTRATGPHNMHGAQKPQPYPCMISRDRYEEKTPRRNLENIYHGIEASAQHLL
ncbi:hypothetical protein SMACR_05264 [Sordaria macrospora]|uniref:WGS project CABT00000000 data, contig 2.8 n=2 Tax=Sordaria macrospora TaxID=5147 RepID=F7VUX6_SORMK|nr:uncharacterized protein SMAC_05264 [Sordaria macrospora k-hell]KAA8636286.1 hypothetical protein SMACR_05264 [Sordaria macrospora]WPJ57376.1 hypothetical protein SMAC4_05264 [Sordaria macrospora]CCC09322.1 unnamed protein product [Sordaria macrospora k-hell]